MAPGRCKAEPNQREVGSRGYLETQESSRQVVGIGDNYWKEERTQSQDWAAGNQETQRGSGSLTQRDLLSNSGPDTD